MATRPNVIILHTDQQRFDSLGCNLPGGSARRVVATPNIDSLADEGVNFQNHFVQNPVCMPSRMCLLTGRYPSNLGIGTNGIPLPADTLTLAGMLKRHGYETALVGKLHFLPHAFRDHREAHPDYGFDTSLLSDEPGCYDDAYRKWVEERAPEALDAINCGIPGPTVEWRKMMRIPYKPHPRDGRGSDYKGWLFEAADELTHAGFVGEETCRCIRERSGKPLFIFAGFYAPHAPLNPPASCLAKIDVEAQAAPLRGPEEKLRPGFEKYTERDWKVMRAYYQAQVADVDQNVGKILKTLADEGIENDTLVVFTSDHGEYAGEHGQLGKGDPGYDCIVRVPLIMRLPGVLAKGTRPEALVESVDVLPTILDLCAAQADPSVQGRSLAALAKGKTSEGRESVLMEAMYTGVISSRMVRTKEHMYALVVLKSEEREYLFDLKSDPNELKNVVDEPGYAKVVAEMRKLLIKRMMDAEGERYKATARF